MVAVDLQVFVGIQETLDKLISRLDGIKSIERDRVLDTGVMSVEGENIIDSHTDELLQSECAVQRFPRSTLGLNTLIEIGHDHCDPAGFAADSSDHTFQVLEMIGIRL